MQRRWQSDEEDFVSENVVSVLEYYVSVNVNGNTQRDGMDAKQLSVEREWIRSEWRRYVSVMENWVFLSKEVA